jgi:hypothetical protein
MKKVLLTLAVIAVAGIFSITSAQIKRPAPSPSCKLEQTAGLTTVTVEYSRPSMKGRSIFGGLLPGGEMWRTGANKNTTIKFSENVKIAGKELKAGTYALFTVPNPTSWDVIFYTDTENWGLPETWDAAKEAVRFKVTPQSLPFDLETFMMDVGNLRNDACSIGLGWERTWVSFDVMLNTDDVVSKSIAKAMAGPDANDYFNAGSYYFDAGKDLKQAYEWIHKSNEADPKFWKLRTEALVLAAMGKYNDAIAMAEKSKAMAIEAGNKDYERMNNESIAEWKMKSGKK